MLQIPSKAQILMESGKKDEVGLKREDSYTFLPPNETEGSFLQRVKQSISRLGDTKHNCVWQCSSENEE